MHVHPCANGHSCTDACSDTRRNAPSHTHVHRHGSHTPQTYTCAHRLARTYTPTNAFTNSYGEAPQPLGTDPPSAHGPPHARGGAPVRAQRGSVPGKRSRSGFSGFSPVRASMAQGVAGSVWCGGLASVWGRGSGRTSGRQERRINLPACFRDPKLPSTEPSSCKVADR